MSDQSRRDFVKAAGVAAAVSLLPTAVHAAGDEKIKVGLVGCGGRGSGAIRDCLKADKAVQVVAVGDVFEEKAKGQASQLAKNFAGQSKIGENVFGGLDAYKKVMDAGIDLVILATPPGFRPPHLEYAVEKNIHIFTEKPVAVDGPGIRKCFELVEKSKKNGKAIVAGTQRRHQKSYLEVYKRIQDGAMGDFVGGRCSWNNQGIWFNPRSSGMSDAVYQLKNWYHFLWLCGDHIVEQHIHNLDVVNWFSGQHPIRAVGMGGRMGGTKARPSGEPKDVGNIWDHFSIELEYANGVKVSSYCRHYPGVDDVSEMVVGSKGTIRTASGGYYTINGKEVYSAEQDGRDTSPYVQEHIDMIASIRAGKPLNELKTVTESTLTAIMGRMAAYTGKAVKWEDAIASKDDTMPKGLTLESSIEVPPVPVPGKTKFV